MSENPEARSQPFLEIAESIEALESLPDGAFQDKGSLCKAVGIDPSALEAVYSLAYGHYEQEKYEEALRTFGLLCLFNHNDPRYWKGLGACSLMLKDYEGAICAFEYATTCLKEDDPELRLHTAECYMRIGNTDVAKTELDHVINATGSASKLNRRAKALQENWTHQ